MAVFVVTGCSASGKSTISVEVGKILKDFAVFDMDLIVSENNYKRAGLNWLNLTLWLSLELEKHTVLFGNNPSPFFLDISYLEKFTKVHHLHLHCDNETRTKRLTKRGWTTKQIDEEIDYADFLYKVASNTPIPIFDTSQSSTKEVAKNIAEKIAASCSMSDTF